MVLLNKMQYFKNINIVKNSSEETMWKSVLNFLFFLVDNIQAHFDNVLMSEIIFLYIPFSDSCFHRFKGQFQFHMPILFQILYSLVGNIEMKVLVC